MVIKSDDKILVTRCHELNHLSVGDYKDEDFNIKCSEKNPELCGIGTRDFTTNNIEKCSIIKSEEGCKQNIFCKWENKKCEPYEDVEKLCNAQNKAKEEDRKIGSCSWEEKENIGCQRTKNDFEDYILGISLFVILCAIISVMIKYNGGFGQLKILNLDTTSLFYKTLFIWVVWIVIDGIVGLILRKDKEIRSKKLIQCYSDIGYEMFESFAIIIMVWSLWFNYRENNPKYMKYAAFIFVLVFIYSLIIRQVNLSEYESDRIDWELRVPYLSRFFTFFNNDNRNSTRKEEKWEIPFQFLLELLPIVGPIAPGILRLINDCPSGSDALSIDKLTTEDTLTLDIDTSKKCFVPKIPNSNSTEEKKNIYSGETISITCNAGYDGGGDYKCVGINDDSKKPSADIIKEHGGFYPKSALIDAPSKMESNTPFQGYGSDKSKTGWIDGNQNIKGVLLSTNKFQYIRPMAAEESDKELNVDDGIIDNDRLQNNEDLKKNGKVLIALDSDGNLHTDSGSKPGKYKSEDVCRVVKPCNKIADELLCNDTKNQRCKWIEDTCMANPRGYQPEKISSCDDKKLLPLTLLSRPTWKNITWLIIVWLLFMYTSKCIIDKLHGSSKGTVTQWLILLVYIVLFIVFLFAVPHWISLWLLDDKACEEGTEQGMKKLLCEYTGRVKAEGDERDKDCGKFGERCSLDPEKGEGDTSRKCKYNCSINPFILMREIFLGADIPKRHWITKTITIFGKSSLLVIPYIVLTIIILKLMNTQINTKKGMVALGVGTIVMVCLPLFLVYESITSPPGIIRNVAEINMNPSSIQCWINNYGGYVPYIVVVTFACMYMIFKSRKGTTLIEG